MRNKKNSHTQWLYSWIPLSTLLLVMGLAAATAFTASSAFAKGGAPIIATNAQAQANKVAHANTSRALAPLDTPTSTPQWDCPASVSPTYIEVPYTGGSYTVNVDVGAQCDWRVAFDGSFPQYYCSHAGGVGPSTVGCDFPTNPGPSGRFGHFSVCTSETGAGNCYLVNVNWFGQPATTPTYTPTSTPTSIPTYTYTLTTCVTPTPTFTYTYTYTPPASTLTPTFTHTPTRLPTSLPNLWPGTAWATPCAQPVLRLTTYSNSIPGQRCIDASTMRLTNSSGDYRDFPVPNFCNRVYESYSFDCVVGSCIPASWLSSLPFTLTADYYNNIFEFNEDDNTMQFNTPPPTCSALVGHVTWQGRPPQPNTLQQLPITLTLRTSTSETNYPTQATDASGYFTSAVSNLANGTYVWRVKGPQYLVNCGGVILTGAPTTSIEMGQMKTGDANNDNVINAADFNILKGTFGKTPGDPGYDASADFTGDNTVNVADFSLLRGNFGQGGAPPNGCTIGGP